MCKVVCTMYDLVGRRAHVVLVPVGVDERYFPFAVSLIDVKGEKSSSTCALCRLDVSKLGALGLDRRPVETALEVGDVASQRVRSFHERLAIRTGYAGYSE